MKLEEPPSAMATGLGTLTEGAGTTHAADVTGDVTEIGILLAGEPVYVDGGTASISAPTFR